MNNCRLTYLQETLWMHIKANSYNKYGNLKDRVEARAIVEHKRFLISTIHDRYEKVCLPTCTRHLPVLRQCYICIFPILFLTIRYKETSILNFFAPAHRTSGSCILKHGRDALWSHSEKKHILFSKKCINMYIGAPFVAWISIKTLMHTLKKTAKICKPHVSILNELSYKVANILGFFF